MADETTTKAAATSDEAASTTKAASTKATTASRTKTSTKTATAAASTTSSDTTASETTSSATTSSDSSSSSASTTSSSITSTTSSSSSSANATASATISATPTATHASSSNTTVTIVAASIFGAFAFVILFSVVGWLIHKRRQKRRSRYPYPTPDTEKQAPAGLQRSDYAPVASTADLPPTLPPVYHPPSPENSQHGGSPQGSPPMRAATTSSRFTNDSSDNTTAAELTAFTLVHPAQASVMTLPTTATTNNNRSRSSSYSGQQQQQQQPDNSVQIYVPQYTQARLSTTTLIPLQVQRSASPENPITSQHGSLHSTTTSASSAGTRGRASSASAIGSRVAAVRKSKRKSTPTIIFEAAPDLDGTESSSGPNSNDDEQHRRSSWGNMGAPATAAAGPLSSSTSSARNSMSGLSVHQQSPYGAPGAAQGRARSSSGSSIQRYYNAETSPLRTEDGYEEEGPGENAPLVGGDGRASAAGARPRSKSELRRSFGPQGSLRQSS